MIHWLRFDSNLLLNIRIIKSFESLQVIQMRNQIDKNRDVQNVVSENHKSKTISNVISEY